MGKPKRNRTTAFHNSSLSLTRAAFAAILLVPTGWAAPSVLHRIVLVATVLTEHDLSVPQTA